MKLLNLIIASLGLFSLFRILIGIILANLHQIKTDKRQRKQFISTKKTKEAKLNYQKEHLFKASFRSMLGLPIPFNKSDILINDQNTLEYYPLVSVVVPAYNEEKNIIECINSLLHQNYYNRQIIVIDDGSTDETPQLLNDFQKEFNKSRMQYRFADSIPENKRLIIVHQKNGGKSVALNNGIKNYATGEIVTVLDSDSTLAPDALARMSQHFKDKHVIAMADNVRIKNTHKAIEHIQEFEYLLGYRLKGSEEILGVNNGFKM